MSLNALFNEWFYYDETSPSCLKWKKDKYSGVNLCSIRIKKDSDAGCKGVNYYEIRLNRKLYYAHHIIHILCLGIPKGIVDHVNGNQLDNRISNLRDIPKKLNSRNRNMSSNNSSGTTGVEFLTHKQSYRARWIESGKTCSKSFSVKNLGDELAHLCAVEYRDKMIRLLNLKGYGYTERHGK